jgi:hypothetical protein
MTVVAKRRRASKQNPTISRAALVVAIPALKLRYG